MKNKRLSRSNKKFDASVLPIDPLPLPHGDPKEGITTGMHYDPSKYSYMSEIKLRSIAVDEYEKHFMNHFHYEFFNPFWQGFKRGYMLAMSNIKEESQNEMPI